MEAMQKKSVNQMKIQTGKGGTRRPDIFYSGIGIIINGDMLT
jgi:hypothetical protein